MTDKSPLFEADAVPVTIAAHRLGVSENTIRRHLPTLRLGRRQIVRVADLERFLRGEMPTMEADHADAA
jgi:predicted ArsR family transcriptional regulator